MASGESNYVELVGERKCLKKTNKQEVKEVTRFPLQVM